MIGKIWKIFNVIMLLQFEILGDEFIILWKVRMLVNQDYPNYYHIKTEMTVIHLKIFVYFSQRQRLILIRVLLFFCRDFCSEMKTRITSWYCSYFFLEIQTLLDARVCTSDNHELNVLHMWTRLVQEYAHAIGKPFTFLSVFSSCFNFKHMLNN